jgi:Flp pilus assembly pilin Flp
VKKNLCELVQRAWRAIRADERGLTTLEYVIAAGIILVILAAAIVAWNTGLAQRIGELVQELLSGS